MQKKLVNKSLFSNETLDSMVMAEVYGAEASMIICLFCSKYQCKCHLDSNCDGADCSCADAAILLTREYDSLNKVESQSVFSVGITTNV